MKQLIILILIAMSTISTKAQSKEDVQRKEQLEFAKKIIDIPIGYVFDKSYQTVTDGNKGYLFRYTKGINDQLGGEHFSFIVTADAPYKLLGFTYMDKRFANKKLISKDETESIARNFLKKADIQLNKNLENQWIDQHDEQIIIDGKTITVTGMKYKCYNKTDNTCTWVIIGSDGTIITFERDIIWSNGMQKRITEKWLHDNWLISTQPEETQGYVNKNDEDIIKEILNQSFINGALNNMNTIDMRKGFHPDFAILIADKDNLHKLPLDAWIDVIEKYKASPQKMKSGARTNINHKYELIDITENAAIVKVQLSRDKALITTDYISLLKFDKTWKAVAKISNEHTPDAFKIKE
jgi:hypothetical protein